MHPLRTLLVTLLMLPVAAAAAGTLDRIKSSGAITLGYGAEARPFSFQDSGGQPLGYGVELCARVVDRLKADQGVPGLKPAFVQVTRTDRLSAVANGKVDLLCDAVVPTPASRQQVSYSIPVFTTGISAVVRKGARSEEHTSEL